jgi:predicted AAA+ superfamily ATPase
VVLNELDRRQAEVGYVKTATGLEVDFLARPLAGHEELIQVCADLSAPETLARELRALAVAANENPHALQRVLVLDRDSSPRESIPGVEIQPAYEWLLAPTTGI